MNDRPNATPRTATMTRSWWFVLPIRSTNLGTVFDPMNSAPPMNASTRPIEMAISSIARPPLTATDWNTASRETIMISSITATPKSSTDALSLIMPSSSSTRITITVLVTEMDSARNRLSKNARPMAWPTT